MLRKWGAHAFMVTVSLRCVLCKYSYRDTESLDSGDTQSHYLSTYITLSEYVYVILFLTVLHCKCES